MPSHHRGLVAPQNTFLDAIVSKFDGTHSNFLLCNARGNKTCPIVYCSDDFCQLTGYSKNEIMGKPCACSFLYGERTSSQAKQLIQVAVNFRTEVKTEILFYRKDGTPYRCWFELLPIKNEKGQEVLFLVLQKNIDEVDLYPGAASVDGAADSNEGNTIGRLQASGNSQRNEKKSAAENDSENESDSQNAGSSTSGADAECGHNGFTKTASEDDEILEKQDKTLGSGRCSRAAKSGRGSGLGSGSRDATSQYEGKKRNDRTRSKMRQSKSNTTRRKIIPSFLALFNAAKARNTKLNTTIQSIKPNEDEIAVPQYKTDDLTHRRFVVRHYGIFRIGWDWLCLICTFYIAIMVPYYAAFLDHQDEDRDFFATDVIVEMLFMIDIMLNFITTYISRSGKVIYDLRLIAWNYLKGWFILDLFAAIPFELLHSINVTTGVRINLLKLARMLRLARLLQKIDRYSQYSAVVLALLMSMFTLVAHWFACIWYVIGKEETEQSPGNWTVGWLHDLASRTQQPFGPNRTAGPSLPSRYITSLYFSTSSLTSVGFGNVSANTIAEKVFSVCAMLIGALMHAAVFGNVTAIIQRMYARRAAYQTKANDLKEFARIHRLPKHLKQRMYEFFQITWSVNHGLDTNTAMNDFPEELRCEISLHLYREVLSLPIFSDGPYGCIKRVAYECIRYRFCTPNELLVNDSDQLCYLYFVSSGSVEILRDGQVVCILGKGDVFGTDLRVITRSSRLLSRTKSLSLTSESDNWMRQQLVSLKSRCDARTMTYCDIYLLDIGKLLSILLRYPEFALVFCSKLQSDISFDLQYVESASVEADQSSDTAAEADVEAEAEAEIEVEAEAKSDAEFEADAEADSALTPIQERDEVVESNFDSSTSFNLRVDAEVDAGTGVSGVDQRQQNNNYRLSLAQRMNANDRELQVLQVNVKLIKENLNSLNNKIDRLIDAMLCNETNARGRDEASSFTYIDEGNDDQV